MKNKKKNIIFLSIGVVTLIIAVLGATYAYFIAQGGGSANTDINVGTSTTDNLAFSFGDLININANEANFAEGMGSITDSTTGTAILKANNATNEANSRYNIYLIIENNDFEYTTEEGIPEILLNVTDPNGKKLENITGLVHYEDGFDITTRTGGFLIVPDYEISATDKETIQDWQVEVTLVNLDSNQNDNTGKTLTGKLYLTQEQMSSYELTEINNIEIVTTYNSVNATLDITNGSGTVAKYYYGIEKVNKTRSATTVEYIETTNPNYEFTNLEANTEYTIYSYVEDENKIKSNIYETKVVTNEFNAPVINSVSHSVTLNSITLNVTAMKGSNEIVKYMYSKDNGSTWEESTSNTYTFNNLKDTTEYKIKVKVIDSEGNESTEYYEAITTEIYILPVVSSVSASTTWNSITLTPSGTDGTNMISKYVYSINGGSYQESNVFNNLTDNTKYTIKVKAIDSANRESNEYTLEVTTDEYKLPVINSVIATATTNSITINVDASNGDGRIVSYHYSKDDGSNYTKSSSNSYTFNSLTSDTTFYIKVYVTDSNGRVSSVYASTQQTEADTITLSFANSYSIDNFLGSCSPQVSYDNGASWQDMTFASNAGGTTTIKKNAQIRLNYSGNYRGTGCAMNICTSSNCSAENNGPYNYNKNDLYTFGDDKVIYTLKGNETHYSLVYCSCLVGNTEVYVLDKDKKKKKKKIKDIKKGDKVIIIDSSGKEAIKKVKSVQKNKVTTTFKVSLSNGEVIECSSRHSFVEASLGILYVEELKVGYELLGMNGNSHKIENIEIVNYSMGVDVYNLEFEENHANVYSIGEGMILTFGIVNTLEDTLEDDVKKEETIGLGDWYKVVFIS